MSDWRETAPRSEVAPESAIFDAAPVFDSIGEWWELGADLMRACHDDPHWIRAAAAVDRLKAIGDDDGYFRACANLLAVQKGILRALKARRVRRG